ncbi:Fibrous sheath-interacting protein 1 [Holothuria leucospilota]|uniref:Fibrous sheath-interacting protein 1 n=1 Tax=Holothuria leucospilota TaxID=206669 RepID=A0A9Q1CI34_HOLLE|nr:Fibrous sheath-interacting protein 1 [Holothuria leucospilota]
MRKLDKILMQKISREKEVKRQRRMMHRQYQDELERIKLGMERKEPKEEMENTERFLALVPPPNHSEDSVKETKQGRGERRRRSKVDVKSAANDEDFIQRNIQLASDAGNTIAMTDDEKNRLGELLKDVEMLGEDQEERKEVTGLELQMLPGTGYKPDKTEEEALKSLDEKLKVLMLPKNFEEICSTPLLENQPKFSNTTYQQEAFELGEKILQDHKVSRDYKDRLKQIEEELVALQTQVEKEVKIPVLSTPHVTDGGMESARQMVDQRGNTFSSQIMTGYKADIGEAGKLVCYIVFRSTELALGNEIILREMERQ